MGVHDTHILVTCETRPVKRRGGVEGRKGGCGRGFKFSVCAEPYCTCPIPDRDRPSCTKCNLLDFAQLSFHRTVEVFLRLRRKRKKEKD